MTLRECLVTSIVALSWLAVGFVRAELVRMYIGELAPDRHYYFIADPEGNVAATYAAHFDEAWRRCREDYGGRPAWLETPALVQAVSSWTVRRMPLLSRHKLCDFLSNAVGCNVVVGFGRPAVALADTEAALNASYWTENPNDPAGAGVNHKPLLEGFGWRFEQASRNRSVFSLVHYLSGAQMGQADRVMGMVYLNKTGLTFLTDRNTTDLGAVLPYMIQGHGWNALCERSSKLTIRQPNDLHFRASAAAPLPDDPMSILAGPFPFGLACGHECGQADGCVAFAVSAAGHCHLYDFVTDQASPNQTGKLYRLAP